MSTEFSTEVKQVAAVFKEYRNSIDIYTEDKNEDKVFYVRLLQRLLSDTEIKINDVHPLGCKKEVITACKSDVDERRCRLYIVDGDIYLQYQQEEVVENLYRLDSYCIENYVICEESICNTAYDLNGGRYPIENVKCRINYHEVLNNSLCLIDLFFWYSIQSELYGNYELRHINSFWDAKNICIDDQRVNDRITEIKAGLISQGYPCIMLERLFASRMQKYGKNIRTLLKIVSGKDYLIPLFCNVINNRVCKVSIPKESWKFQFSKTCGLDGLNGLKKAILAVCKQ